MKSLFHLALHTQSDQQQPFTVCLLCAGVLSRLSLSSQNTTEAKKKTTTNKPVPTPQRGKIVNYFDTNNTGMFQTTLSFAL